MRSSKSSTYWIAAGVALGLLAGVLTGCARPPKPVPSVTEGQDPVAYIINELAVQLEECRAAQVDCLEDVQLGEVED